jgi:hypothetical protein
MIHYWAVLLDETGCEFGAGVEARNKQEAYEYLHENYPESRVVQLESPEETHEREARIWREAERDMYGDYAGEDLDYDDDEL